MSTCSSGQRTAAPEVKVELQRASSLECIFCCRTFTARPSLAQHLLEHNSVQPFYCCFCCENFTSRSRLDIHFLHVHRIGTIARSETAVTVNENDVVRPQRQEQSNAQSTEQMEELMYQRLQEEEQQNEQKISPKTKATPRARKLRRTNVASVVSKRRRATTRRHQQHQRLINLGLLVKKNIKEVKLRERTIPNSTCKAKQVQHKGRQKSGTTYTCHLCKKGYQRPLPFHRHIDECALARGFVESGEACDIRCEFCELLCKSSGALWLHVNKQHANDRHWTCKICQAVFPSVGKMHRHVRRFRAFAAGKLSHSRTDSAAPTTEEEETEDEDDESSLEDPGCDGTLECDVHASPVEVRELPGLVASSSRLPESLAFVSLPRVQPLGASNSFD